MVKLIMMLPIISLLLVLGVAGYNTDPSRIDYVLWTRPNKQFSRIQRGNTRSLEASTFNASRQTYFLFHGYTDNAFKEWVLDTKDALLSVEDCNVFCVQYKDFVRFPYFKAVSNMYRVAAAAGSFIDWLVDGFGLSTGRIHLIGHSLGAHAAGMTAYYVRSGQIDRVTGLDPAGPRFENKGSNQRLDKSHARFVDVIHSNACSSILLCKGIVKPIGHVDFYPNGGKHQKGCPKLTPTLRGIFKGGCSHQVVTKFWIESVTAVGNQTTKFKSWPCQSCQYCGQGCLDMGLHVQRNLEGSYYLSTSRSSPYALGNYGKPQKEKKKKILPALVTMTVLGSFIFG